MRKLLFAVLLLIPCAVLAQFPPYANPPAYVDPGCVTGIVGNCNNYGYTTPTVMNTHFNDTLPELDLRANVSGQNQCFHQAGTNSWLVPYLTPDNSTTHTNGTNFQNCLNSAALAVNTSGVSQTIVMQCNPKGNGSCTAPLVLTSGNPTVGCMTNAGLANLDAEFCLPVVIQQNYASPAHIYIVSSAYAVLPPQNTRLNPYIFDANGSSTGSLLGNDLWRITIQNRDGRISLLLPNGASYYRFIGGELTSESTATPTCCGSGETTSYRTGATIGLIRTSGAPRGQNRLISVTSGGALSYCSSHCFELVQRNNPAKALVVSQTPQSMTVGTSGNVVVKWINNFVSSAYPHPPNPWTVATISSAPNNQITVADASHVNVNEHIADAAGSIPNGTVVTAVSGTTVTLSNSATTNQTNDNLFVWSINPQTTATIASAPTTSITVADASQLQIGQFISDQNGSIPTGTTITNIVGTTITLSASGATNQTNDNIYAWPTFSWSGGQLQTDCVSTPCSVTVNSFSNLVCTADACSATVNVSVPLAADAFQRVSVANGQNIAVPMPGQIFSAIASGANGNTLTIKTSPVTNGTDPLCTQPGPTNVKHTQGAFTMCFHDPNAQWTVAPTVNLLALGDSIDPLLSGASCGTGLAGFTTTGLTPDHDAYAVVCPTSSSIFINTLIHPVNISVNHRLNSGPACTANPNSCSFTHSALYHAIEVSDQPQWIQSITCPNGNTAAPGDTSIACTFVEGIGAGGTAWNTSVNCSSISACAAILNMGAQYNGPDKNCIASNPTGSTTGCIDVLSIALNDAVACAGQPVNQCFKAIISVDPHTMDGANNIVLDRMFLHGRDTTFAQSTNCNVDGLGNPWIACPFINPQTTAATVNNSPTITVADPTKLAVGQKIEDNFNAIPANTTILSISGNSVTLSQNATATWIGSDYIYTVPSNGTLPTISPPRVSTATTGALPSCTGTALRQHSNSGTLYDTDSGLCAHTTGKGAGDWPVFWTGGGSVDVQDAAVMDGAFNAVVDSWFDEMHQFNQDYTDIDSKESDGPLKVDNNHLGEATENVFFGGSGSTTASPWRPANIEDRQNYVIREPAYRLAGIGAMGYGGTVTNNCSLTNATSFNRCDIGCTKQWHPGCQVWAFKNDHEFKIGVQAIIEGNVGNGCVTGQIDFPQNCQIVELDARGGQQGTVLSPMYDWTVINNVGLNHWGGMLTLGHDDECFLNGIKVAAYTDVQCSEKLPGIAQGPYTKRFNLINNMVERLTPHDEGTMETNNSASFNINSEITSTTDEIWQHNTIVPQAGHDYTTPTVDYLGYPFQFGATVYGQYFNQTAGLVNHPSAATGSTTHNIWYVDNVSWCAPIQQALSSGDRSLFTTGLTPPQGPEVLWDPNPTNTLPCPNAAVSNYATRFQGNIHILPTNGSCDGRKATQENNQTTGNAFSWPAYGMCTVTDTALVLSGTGTNKIFANYTQTSNDELGGADLTYVDTNNDTNYNAANWKGSVGNCSAGAPFTSTLNSSIFGASATVGVCMANLKQAIQYPGTPFGVQTGTYGVTALAIPTQSLNGAELTFPYNQNVTIVGGTGTYTALTVASGALPTGLSPSIVSNNGTISGTPTSTCTNSQGCLFTFTLQVTDSNSTTATSPTLTITLYPGMTFVPGIGLPVGAVGAAYNYTLQFTGGGPPFSFDVNNSNMTDCGQGLYDNMCFDSVSGVLSGTPTFGIAPGAEIDSYQVCDTPGNCIAINLGLTINSNLAWSNQSACQNGTVGAAYSCLLTPTGGTGPYAFAISSGSLCSGLSLACTSNCALNDSITGTVGSTQSCTFIVKVTDSLAATATSPQQSITFTASSTLITVTATTPMPPAIVGVAYGANADNPLTATGGTQPYTWNIISGGLPPGMQLQSSGLVSGAPTQQGTFNFVVQASDNLGDTPGTLPMSITVNAATGANMTGANVGKGAMVR